MPRVVLVTGLQAAGKSTIGPLLAERLGPPALSFDGDVVYTGVVSGRAVMTQQPTPEAERQLRLRYDGSALLAQHYADNGFDFVCSDIVLGRDVARWLDLIERADRHLVVLAPTLDAVAQREHDRGGQNSYRGWQSGDETLADGIRALAAGLDEIPRRGLWLDTTDLTPEESVEQILTDDLASSRW
jgi:chloramphenicol 3-O-phosphotransferase